MDIGNLIKLMTVKTTELNKQANGVHKKFKKGDILKAAGWNAPARNAARGNILDGGYAINWTGACYL